jgi:uncharacterized protein
LADLTPRITIITLGVADMIRMRAFYEALGFVASAASNQSVTFFDANGVVLGLFGHAELAHDAKVMPEAMQRYKGSTLAWNATSEAHVDDILSHAKACGANILKPAEKVFWGGYSGYFSDPENNMWEVAFNPFFGFNDRMQLQLP